MFYPYSPPRRDDTWRSRRDAAATSRIPEDRPVQSWQEYPPAATEPRHVPGPLAPVELVEIQDCFSPTFVRVIARDPSGANRLELYIERDDSASIRWFVKVLRMWLAWRHKAIALRLLKHG